MLSHANITAAVTALAGTGVVVNEHDVVLHYLPLAHSFAFMVESVMFLYGVQLGYGVRICGETSWTHVTLYNVLHCIEPKNFGCRRSPKLRRRH